MSNQTDDLDLDLDTDDSGDSGDDLKSLRAAANRAKRTAQERDAAIRELAFVKAGIDTDNPRLAYFYKGYDGELSKDAIRQAAAEAGFITETPDPQVAQHQQGQAVVVAAGAGTDVKYDGSDAQTALRKAFDEGGVEGLVRQGMALGIPIAEET